MSLSRTVGYFKSAASVVRPLERERRGKKRRVRVRMINASGQVIYSEEC
jgi:hypothetical protein